MAQLVTQQISGRRSSRNPWQSLAAPFAAAGLLLSVLLTASSPAEALTPLTGWRQGQSSFYGGQPDGMNPQNPSYGTSVGSCGYGLLAKNAWPFWSVGALATSNMYYQTEPLFGCGECFEVQCVEDGPEFGAKPGSCNPDTTQRSIVIQITDSCPECRPDQIDLQALTWAKIAKPSPSGGRINMQYRRVECSPPTDLVVDVDNNLAGTGWIRMQINMAGGPANVKSVALQSASGGEWQELNNLFGAAWEIGSHPEPPLNVKITNAAGVSVVAPNAIEADETGELPTSVQFKVQDPSDVQPSGNVLGVADQAGATSSASASASSGSGSASSAASAGSAPASPSAGSQQVSAFQGPPDTSSNNPFPSPSSTQPALSTSASWESSMSSVPQWAQSMFKFISTSATTADSSASSPTGPSSAPPSPPPPPPPPPPPSGS